MQQMLTEDVLMENLPEGWTYDVVIREEIWAFQIIGPDVEFLSIPYWENPWSYRGDATRQETAWQCPQCYGDIFNTKLSHCPHCGFNASNPEYDYGYGLN